MHYWDEETIQKIRQGFYSAVYFNRTKDILLNEQNLTPVTMQIFQKKDNVRLGGVAMVIELFKQATGYMENNNWINKFDALTIETLHDGEMVNGWETIIHITGPYAYFAHLESLYLGILARATNIATNSHAVITAAKDTPVAFFADRFDYFLNQSLDGYAAAIGGITKICTPAHGLYIESKPVGTIPHALIAIHHGETIAAAESFVKQYPDVPLIVLVDFQNDCVKTSLEVAKHFGKKLWGVRLDTSEILIDKSLQTSSLPLSTIRGVNEYVVRNVREALDKEGFTDVKIVVSGGFTAEKIQQFGKNNVPVDLYGVGSSLIQGNIDFTADIVKVDGKTIAKEGRTFTTNKLLRVIDSE